MQITAGQSTEMNLYGPDTQTGERGARVLHVVIHHFGTFISLLFTGHAGLDRALPVDEARAYLGAIKQEAKVGTAVWAINEMAGVWTSAAAVLDQAEQDMIEGIRANMDAMQPEPVDVSDILDGGEGGSFDGYQAERRKAREQAARFATRSQVHLQPPTEAELGRIRAHVHGIVTCGPGQNWTLLRAIVRRNLGDIHEVHGRHVIASVRLNARGMALTEQNGQVAA